jgi:hypothetical protein
MRPPTHGVTLHPEWGFAFAHLGKDRENRPWALPESFVGRSLAIHSGAWIGGLKSPSMAELGLEGLFTMAERAGWELDRPYLLRGVPNRGDLTARIVGRRGVAPYVTELDEVIACRSIVAVAIFDGNEEHDPDHLAANASPWAVGPFAWRAAEVITLKRPVRRLAGALGLWRLTEEERSAIAEQLLVKPPPSDVTPSMI